jgi:hypothetical protein
MYAQYNWSPSPSPGSSGVPFSSSFGSSPLPSSDGRKRLREALLSRSENKSAAAPEANKPDSAVGEFNTDTASNSSSDNEDWQSDIVSQKHPENMGGKQLTVNQPGNLEINLDKTQVEKPLTEKQKAAMAKKEAAAATKAAKAAAAQAAKEAAKAAKDAAKEAANAAKEAAKAEKDLNEGRGANWTMEETYNICLVYKNLVLRNQGKKEDGETTDQFYVKLYQQYTDENPGSTRTADGCRYKITVLRKMFNFINDWNETRICGSTGQPPWFECTKEQRKELCAKHKNMDITKEIYDLLEPILGDMPTSNPTNVIDNGSTSNASDADGFTNAQRTKKKKISEFDAARQEREERLVASIEKSSETQAKALDMMSKILTALISNNGSGAASD